MSLGLGTQKALQETIALPFLFRKFGQGPRVQHGKVLRQQHQAGTRLCRRTDLPGRRIQIALHAGATHQLYYRYFRIHFVRPVSV